MTCPTPYRIVLLVAGLLTLAAGFAVTPAGGYAAGASIDVRASKHTAIWKENRHKGTISWELTKPAYSPNTHIEGYASATSVAPGQRIDFHVSTLAPSFRADVYRMGWYGGLGARHRKAILNVPGHEESTPAPDPQTGLIVCNWPVSFGFTVPKKWLTGMYLVKLTDADGFQSYISFVVRATTAPTYLFVHASATEEAYNNWGGKSLYGDTSYSQSDQVNVDGKTINAYLYHRALEVSFDRPFTQNFGAGEFFNWEYRMVRWMERHGDNVGYATDVDVDQDPALLQKPKAIVIVGHDEYWSAGMRANVQAAVNAGVNLAVFAGNTLWWQIRYQPSASGTPDRIIVCYKTLDPNAYNATDPDAGTPLETTNWRLAPVNQPESLLIGASYGGTGPLGKGTGAPWIVENASSWVYAGTGLHDGDQIPGINGDEFDGVVSAFPEPAGVQLLSNSPMTGAVKPGPGIQNATLYTAPSGARVFDAAQIDWSFGIDTFNPPYPDARTDHLSAPIPAVQTITDNILANFATKGTATATR